MVVRISPGNTTATLACSTSASIMIITLKTLNDRERKKYIEPTPKMLRQTMLRCGGLKYYDRLAEA